MALALTITSIGRDDLALAVAQSDSLTITSVLLTNAQTTGTAQTVKKSSDLGGSVVATMTATGKKIATGKVQVEGNDNTTATYEAKTLALVYSKDSETRVFAYYTNAETFIYKVSDTAVMIAAAIAIEDSQASSITFSNVTLTFPTATTSTKGAVRLGNEGSITSPVAPVADDPIVSRSADVGAVILRTLGSNCFGTDRKVDLLSQLSVGTATPGNEQTYYVNDFSLSGGFYVALMVGVQDTYALVNDTSWWEMGSTKGYFALIRITGGENVPCLVTNAGALFGIIMRSTSIIGRYELRLVAQPTDNVVLYPLRTDAVIKTRKVSANIIEADEISSLDFKSGGDKTLSMPTTDFYKIDSSTWRYKYPIALELFNGREIKIPSLTINHTYATTTSFNGTSRTWTYNGRTYTYSYNANSFTCSGAAPESNIEFIFTENGSIVSSGDVSSRGFNLVRCGHLGYAKVLISPITGVTNPKIDVVDAYNVNVSESNGNLLVEYLGSQINKNSSWASTRPFVEIICEENVLENGTRNCIVLQCGDTSSSGRPQLTYQKIKAPGTSQRALLIRVY